MYNSILVALVLVAGVNLSTGQVVRFEPQSGFTIGKPFNVSCLIEQFDPNAHYKYRIFVRFNSTDPEANPDRKAIEIGGYEAAFGKSHRSSNN